MTRSAVTFILNSSAADALLVMAHLHRSAARTSSACAPTIMNAFSKTVFASCAAWLFTCIALGSVTTNSPEVGDVPPPLTLSTIVQGPAMENITWDKLKGKVVVLEFWNTACGPCIQAIPHMNELVTQFSRRPVVFLCVSDDNQDHLKKFLGRKPIKGWVALDAPLKPTETAFAVVGIPHTVIVDRSGRIAAITHPALLKAQHLEEILAGNPSTLPAPKVVSTADAPVVMVSNSLPTTVDISIEGPFPQPDGAFGFRGWKASNCIFEARKALVQDVLAEFFRISPKLIFKETKLPKGLYDIAAAGPPEQMPELERQFIAAVKKKWAIEVQIAARQVSVYAMTVGSTNAPGLRSVQKPGGGGEKPGGFFLGGQPMRLIASYLESSLDKPVVDETGLQGLWAADLKWEMSRWELLLHFAPDPAKVIEATRQQLGLELRPAFRTLLTVEIRAPK